MGKLPALILVSFCFAITANAQGPTTLQLTGTPIERALIPGQVHEFTVKLEENTYIQIAVEQRGIDVIVKVLSPNNKSLGEFDSPTGDEGTENVSFVAAADGIYRLTIAALDPTDTTEGRYQIKVIESRPATDQELKTSKNREAVRAKGLALLADVEELIAQIKSPQTRISSQLQAAQLLWPSDEKRAAKYLADAIAGVKELLATIDPGSQQYFQHYSEIWQLRQEIVQALAARDAEAALSFLSATVPPGDPFGNQGEQMSQEKQLELTIANEIMRNDPNRALKIARQSLKTGCSMHLLNTLLQLKQQSPELATELANDIATRLVDEKLITDGEGFGVGMNLLRFSTAPQASSETAALNSAASRPRLLSDDKYRELFQKMLTEALSYSPSSGSPVSPERNAAWNMLTALQSLGPSLDTIASGTMAMVEKKMAEFNTFATPPAVDASQPYVAMIASSPPDAALQALEKAPAGVREQLYMQLANREAGNGDIARARQIINDHVSNPFQRREQLMALEQQAIYQAVNKGKVDEALRGIAGLRTPRERAAQLAQVANQIGPGLKRANAIRLLEQARSLLGPSPQAPDEDQRHALFEIGLAFSRYDSKRAFEIVDPLVDQINELCTAARALNGFGADYFEDDELNLQNDSGVAKVASQMSTVLGGLAFTNFESAKAAADRIRLPEIRLKVYLEIAQQTSQAGK
jgi:hypothetical protein